jgi:hypothetical protein
MELYALELEKCSWLGLQMEKIEGYQCFRFNFLDDHM